MKDFKVRCISDDGSGAFTKGEIYQVVGGSMLDRDGDLRGAGFDSVDAINHRFSSQFEPVDESKMFTKGDLKAGYVLEIDGNADDLVMVLPYNDALGSGMCISGKKCWWPVDEFDDNLSNGEHAVTRVYGLTNPHDAHMVNSDCRKLIWERNPVKEISVDEATKLLTEKFGQNVRIRVGG